MSIEKNEFGVPQFPESDARHLFVLLAAIELLERPTVSAIADLTSMPKDTIELGLQILQQQYLIELRKVGDVIHIASWGDILNRNGIMRCMKAESAV